MRHTLAYSTNIDINTRTNAETHTNMHTHRHIEIMCTDTHVDNTHAI